MTYDEENEDEWSTHQASSPPAQPLRPLHPHDRPEAQAAAEHLLHQVETRGPVACQTTDPEAWYPDNGQPSALVLQLCGNCPVNGACLDYSLAADERYGIWGGTTPTQRTAIRGDNR